MRTPNINSDVFKSRRDNYAEHGENKALIIPSNPEYIRNNDVHYDYRQDSYFYYFTGFEEPGSIFVLRPGKNPEAVLFVRPKDKNAETWTGFRYGPEGAEKEFGMDKGFLDSDLKNELPKLLNDVDGIHYRLMDNKGFDKTLTEILDQHRSSKGRSGAGLLSITDPSETAGEMRLIKTEADLKYIRKACEITSNAHIEAMKFTRPGRNERDIMAHIQYQFRLQGSGRDGYGAIVATGSNATTLHYVFNDQECQDGDLLLIDAGAEYNYYSADITRTFPVNGKFTPDQKVFYQSVLEVQKKILSMIQPGIEFQSLQEETIRLLTEAMLELGILSGTADKIIENQSYKKYYPHGVSHWLGMDVHDVGLYKKEGKNRKLESGMVFTVEPGLYVPFDDKEAPAKFRGMGVRIEDDVLVTPTGVDNLTSKVPKEVEEMEDLIGKG